jgi:aspartate aminotransferase/aminotransferase
MTRRERLDNAIAKRMDHLEASGIRRVFDLARTLTDPVNLSIGQPHFDVPDPIKKAAHDAIDRGFNSYTVTQGIPELRGKLQAQIDARYRHADRQVFVTSGTSGGILLALCCFIDPGDEVILFDPYFVMYPHLVNVLGGRPVFVDTYPSFQLDPDQVRQAITPRTKAILINSPANPTGAVFARDALKEVAVLARERNILLLSDEIYRVFCYGRPFTSPAEFNEETLVFDGFSKAYGMTGWRLGYAHGPARLIEEMIKLQQFTFVCAPSMVQYAGVAALDWDTTSTVKEYEHKRDRLYEGIREHFEVTKPDGAFYLFPRAAGDTGTEFVSNAIRSNLLCIPGGTFSRRDTHFRLSYAASDETIDRGIRILNQLAEKIHESRPVAASPAP